MWWATIGSPAEELPLSLWPEEVIRPPANGAGQGFCGIEHTDRLERHESRRRTMAHVADHLSVLALEQQYRSCTDVTTARHFQTIWLLAKGHEIAEVAATVSFARRWVERLRARYTAHGPQLNPCFGNVFWFKRLRGRARLLASHGMVLGGEIRLRWRRGCWAAGQCERP